MKLLPTKLSTVTHKEIKKINTNKINKNHTVSSDVFFKGSRSETQKKINSDAHSIKNSQKFKLEMTFLRDDSLKNKKSLDDFLLASMYLYINNAINFPIKEDFFEYKIKNRFIQIMKKSLEHQIEGNLSEYLQENYGWGLFNGKYGGYESFATAIPCVLPYAKGYEVELKMLKLKEMEQKELSLRKEINRQDKIISAKEQLSNEYLKPVQAAQKDSSLELPNSIMLECKDRLMADGIIQWALSNISARPIAIGTGAHDSNSVIKNKLKSALENAGKTYENFGTPTLIYCENFDKLLQASNPASEIAAIKALLSNTYKKYHATVIFTTANSDTIENVLKQPHRMKQIKVE